MGEYFKIPKFLIMRQAQGTIQADWARSSASSVHLPSSREHRCKAQGDAEGLRRVQGEVGAHGAVGSSKDANQRPDAIYLTIIRLFVSVLGPTAMRSPRGEVP